MLLLSVSSSSVEAATYEIDPVHSSVEFKVRHLVGRVTGRLGKFSGTIEFDEKNPAAGSVRATVDVASIDTRIPDRDSHLRNADFFDVEHFPEAAFVTKRVDPAAGKLVADLTLHGVTKEVTLDYAYNGATQDTWGNMRIGGTATGKIDRRDFGITYDPTGVTIGHDVDLTLEIEAIQKKT
jgi:polyisoprenoid-binding protein YceI